MIKGYFIQYKFILPENIKHSSYTYQKLFRALYGYTQAVYKSTGKKYKYNRKGLLSNIPFIRSGKNCVTIPINTLQILTKFFQTGINPSHKWTQKGEWKAVYYMDEKVIQIKDASKAIELLMKRLDLKLTKGKTTTLYDVVYTKSNDFFETLTSNDKEILTYELKKITSNQWFKESLNDYPKLDNVKKVYNLLKN